MNKLGYVCLLLSFMIFQIDVTGNIDEIVNQKELEQLSSISLRQKAIDLWNNGEKEDALTVITYIIDNKEQDYQAAKVTREGFLKQIREDDSVVGVVKSFTYGFITGETEDISSISGSVASDFFLYGDIRDLIVQTFKEEKDKFIIILSAIGVLTTVLPHIDGVVNFMKVFKKIKILSPKLVRNLSKLFVIVKRGLKNGAMLFLNNAKKIFKHVNFSMFKKVFKNIDSAKSIVRFIPLLKNKTFNMKRFNRILALSGRYQKKVYDLVLKTKGKGLKVLEKVAKKGEAGFKLLFKPKTLLGPVQLLSTLKTPLRNKEHAGILYEHYGDMVFVFGCSKFFPLAACEKVARVVIDIMFKYILLFMGLIILFGTKVRSLMNFVLKRKQDSKDSISTKSSIKLTGELIKDFKLIKNNKRYEAYFKVLTIAGLLILSYLLLFDWGHSVAIDSNLGNNNFTGSKGTSGALIVFIFWICAQLATLNFCNKEIANNMDNKDKVDFFVDLPLYIGLAGTVISFLFLEMGMLGTSKISAYTSTIFGILASLYLKYIHILAIPNERKVIDCDINKEGPSE